MKLKFLAWVWVLSWAFGNVVNTPIAHAEEPITYPQGTSMMDAWRSPPKIGPEEAARVLIERLFAEERSEEYIPYDRQLEAMKYLIADAEITEEAELSEEGTPNYLAVRLPDGDFSADTQVFHELFLTFLLRQFDLYPGDDPCVIVEEGMFAVPAIKWHSGGFNSIHVFGVVNFALRFATPTYESAIVYGVFPIGLDASWWQGTNCKFFNRPDSLESIRACGKERDWKVQGGCETVSEIQDFDRDCTWLKMNNSYVHGTPFPADQSFVYRGAVEAGEAGRFQTHNRWPTTNTGEAFGWNNVPLPTHAFPIFSFTGELTALWSVNRYKMLTSWRPSIFLNTAVNRPIDYGEDEYRYFGKWDGNPHNVGQVGFKHKFSRWSGPFCE